MKNRGQNLTRTISEKGPFLYSKIQPTQRLVSPSNKFFKSNSKSPGSVKWNVNLGWGLKLPMLIGNRKEIVTTSTKEAQTARI